MPTISPMAPINPQISFWDRLGLLGGGMAQNNVLGAMAQMQNMQQNMLQLRLQQEQQVLAERRRQQALAAEQQRRARLAALAPRMFPDDPNMQALAVEQPDEMWEMYRAGQPKPVMPTTAERNYAASGGLEGTGKTFAEWYATDFKTGGTTTVNVGGQPVSSGEAEAYAGMETIISGLDRLQEDLEAGADLSGFKGLLTELQAAPTMTGAALRAVLPMDETQERAARRAAMIQAQVVDFINSGVATDEDIIRLNKAIALIGGPDTEAAVKDLRETLSTRYSRRRQMRGQSIQPQTSTGGRIKFLGFE